MGGEDIKLFAMIGLFLGGNNSLLSALLSVCVGVVFGFINIVYNKLKNKNLIRRCLMEHLFPFES